MKNNFSYIIALTILFLFSACGVNETNPLIVTTMSGKVVTKEGTAIPKAKVLAAGKEVITNDKGVYSFKITHQGSFTIAAFAEGYKTSSENITEKTSRTLEKEIRLDGIDKSKPLIVTTVSGKVVTKEGTAIPNAKVLAAGKEVMTNDKGVYSFKITHQGSFTIAAFAEGYKTGFENITEKTSRTLEKEIRLAAVDKTKPLIVTTMSGKVVTEEGTPIPKAKVLAAGKEVITNDKGVYSFKITHQGSFTIAAFAEGYKTSFENITQNTSRALEKDIRLDFAYKVKITGKVTGPDDKPIADAEVQAVTGRGGKPLVVQTKADGTYELLLNCALPPILSAKKCGYCVTVSVGITRTELATRTVTRNFKLTNVGCEVVPCR